MDIRTWLKMNSEEIVQYLQYTQQAQHLEAIKIQTIGESLQVHRLENLTRYETHLDRKFEHTLAMLVKLKELRGEIKGVKVRISNRTRHADVLQLLKFRKQL